ncbi:rubredoxin-like domain-containing protein [Paludibacter sp.]|uniref:rubredoxin-like domain-containing protein n=1 Tax=Paludibacter sp. TaxID=1898105 RepID=UPI001352DEB0|nr:hypothetical protein [Paludibacter sp.]MTK52526.1 hypothetical protein [Paludibacter sp.]
MKELVRCKPCGYVMEADKLGDVCPACGMPRKAFEPYRERVAANRLLVLSLDMHPIAIHLSQTFVIMIPVLMAFLWLVPNLLNEVFSNVLIFTIYVYPLTILASIATGIIDGLFRFKSLTPPLLKAKIFYSCLILISSGLTFALSYHGEYNVWGFICSLFSLGFAVRLGLLGKHLIDVILPGSYPVKKGKVPAKEA